MNGPVKMFRWGHRHFIRDQEPPNDTMVKKVQVYDFVTCCGWLDYLRFSLQPSRVYVREDFVCRYTTEKFYPYQADRGIVTVDSEDNCDVLERMAVKGRVYIRAIVPKGTGRGTGTFKPTDVSFSYMDDAPCVVVLSFAHKKSAMMAKLALG